MILPGTGRGTAPRSGVVEGECRKRTPCGAPPPPPLRGGPPPRAGED